MPLSWNEIRSRAIAFSREWTARELPPRGAEKAEAQTFWNEFFEVFGKKRRHVAAFEAPVKNLGGNFGRIDLLWLGGHCAACDGPFVVANPDRGCVQHRPAHGAHVSRARAIQGYSTGGAFDRLRAGSDRRYN